LKPKFVVFERDKNLKAEAQKNFGSSFIMSIIVIVLACLFCAAKGTFKMEEIKKRTTTFLSPENTNSAHKLDAIISQNMNAFVISNEKVKEGFNLGSILNDKWLRFEGIGTKLTQFTTNPSFVHNWFIKQLSDVSWMSIDDIHIKEDNLDHTESDFTMKTNSRIEKSPLNLRRLAATSPHSSMNPAIVAGIVIIVMILLVAVLGFFCCCRVRAGSPTVVSTKVNKSQINLDVGSHDSVKNKPQQITIDVKSNSAKSATVAVVESESKTELVMSELDV
jgi:hypothetical protein